ncbi:MAG TPA: FkbM family methyltransferase, partial [Steroidobacteraceae bacterium]
MAIAPGLIRAVPSLPLKRLVWSLVRRREFDYTTTTPDGLRIEGNTRDWIQRMLYYFGLWEPNLSAWLVSRLAPGDVFVDVGANVGYFTLLAARRVGPSGSVVAVEAMPAIYQHLLRHVRSNALANCRCVNEAAVGPDAQREVALFWGGAGNIGSSGMIASTDVAQPVRVPARPLREILTDDECRRARVIKVDVEGVEAEAIRGLGLDSGRFDSRLELIVEVVHQPERMAERDWLLRHFQDLGYCPYVLPESHNFRAYAY